VSSFIQAENLELFTPAGRPLAHPLTFNISPGEMLLIEGPNGAGKSTLLKAMLGLHRHYRGQVSSSLRGHEIAYLPQLGNVQFFLPLNLGDVVRLQRAKTDHEIEKLKLLDRHQLTAAWNSASGGERQKALLSRTLLSQAKLFVLDEPFNHLDQAGRENVQHAVLALLEQKCAVVVVSHNAHWSTGKIQRLKLEERRA
jgi:ABC-type Mn2+/Zn2+ transport system ATPase subunit